MPSWIVKLADDEYVEWSTIVDAPTTYIVSRDEAVAEWGAERVNRADFHVTSAWPGEFHCERAEEFIEGNRAGTNESELTLDELRHQYRYPAPDQEGGW